MSLTLLPDISRAVSELTRAQPEFAALAGGRLYTVVPAEKTFPLGRITTIGGQASSRPYWLQTSIVQVDIWADTRAAAHQVAETVRSISQDRFVGVHHLSGGVDCVIAGVTSGGLRESADTENPREGHHRVSFDLVITSHPDNTVGS